MGNLRTFERRMREQGDEPARSREQAGHTQVQAARTLGVPSRAWQAWEDGDTPMLPALLWLYRHMAGLEPIPFQPTEYPGPDAIDD
jgi:DNA-binding XRE family transcriptional regulator